MIKYNLLLLGKAVVFQGLCKDLSIEEAMAQTDAVMRELHLQEIRWAELMKQQQATKTDTGENVQ